MIIKCKTCGGELDFKEGRTVCECEYCGNKQTLPEEELEKIRCALSTEKMALKNELSEMKGLFSGRRRRELEKRIAEIETQLESVGK